MVRTATAISAVALVLVVACGVISIGTRMRVYYAAPVKNGVCPSWRVASVRGQLVWDYYLYSGLPQDHDSILQIGPLEARPSRRSFWETWGWERDQYGWHALGAGFSKRRDMAGEVDALNITVPHWLLGVVFAILPVRWLSKTWRWRRRLKEGLCVHCGYDLRATPLRCPECGCSPGRQGRDHPMAWRWAVGRRLLGLFAAMSLVIASAILAVWVRSSWNLDTLHRYTLGKGNEGRLETIEVSCRGIHYSSVLDPGAAVHPSGAWTWNSYPESSSRERWRLTAIANDGMFGVYLPHWPIFATFMFLPAICALKWIAVAWRKWWRGLCVECGHEQNASADAPSAVRHERQAGSVRESS